MALPPARTKRRAPKLVFRNQQGKKPQHLPRTANPPNFNRDTSSHLKLSTSPDRDCPFTLRSNDMALSSDAYQHFWEDEISPDKLKDFTAAYARFPKSAGSRQRPDVLSLREAKILLFGDGADPGFVGPAMDRIRLAVRKIVDSFIVFHYGLSFENLPPDKHGELKFRKMSLELALRVSMAIYDIPDYKDSIPNDINPYHLAGWFWDARITTLVSSSSSGSSQPTQPGNSSSKSSQPVLPGVYSFFQG
ncbi:hypothetical protein TWF481_002808 [Arthrobotrys musiformis]|uniref:Uncharacterized protein n=1 Tax=Arthrobotrys musiformis TaxID=47236 RepID=A0AAV9VT90_9PEZI